MIAGCEIDMPESCERPVHDKSPKSNYQLRYFKLIISFTMFTDKHYNTYILSIYNVPMRTQYGVQVPVQIVAVLITFALKYLTMALCIIHSLYLLHTENSSICILCIWLPVAGAELYAFSLDLAWS